MMARALAMIALAGGGCTATFAGGGNWQRGEPAEPNPAGVHLRGGIGHGGGNRHGWVAGAGEYRRVGDFNSAGVAVEGGLFLFDFSSPRPPPEDERDRLVGSGFSLRGRLAAGGWGAEPDAIVLEGGVGIGYDIVEEKGGPTGLALNLSVFRAALGDRDALWSVGINLSGTGTTAALADMFR